MSLSRFESQIQLKVGRICFFLLFIVSLIYFSKPRVYAYSIVNSTHIRRKDEGKDCRMKSFCYNTNEKIIWSSSNVYSDLPSSQIINETNSSVSCTNEKPNLFNENISLKKHSSYIDSDIEFENIHLLGHHHNRRKTYTPSRKRAHLQLKTRKINRYASFLRQIRRKLCYGLLMILKRLHMLLFDTLCCIYTAVYNTFFL